MRTAHGLPVALALLSAACLAGCGKGGGGVSGASGAAGTTGEQVVVAFDFNTDGWGDVLTLDFSTAPARIVTALQGDASGGYVDATAQLKGQAIDGKLSDAIAAYVAGSLEVASGTDLETVDSAGREITVTVYE